ncbi:hypothetical protein LUZ60_004521 [Juncus effusus]|nr:hypothetical protein LUZ60_004521 [Juncus effusus]
MMDSRRQSVEMPLTKTLVQLKRVRSLRDPSTYSLHKFTQNPPENSNWETNSTNGYTDGHAIETHIESDQIKPPANPKTNFHRKSNVVKIRGLNHQNKPKLAYKVKPRKSIESKSTQFDQQEQLNSYDNQKLDLPLQNNTTTKKKLNYPNFLKSAAMSRVGSPCISISETRSNEISNFSGCGISYCWSGGSKYHNMNNNNNPFSDSEESNINKPLLSPNCTGSEINSRETNSQYVNSVTNTPRSLSQKFRPRSFNDLIGLNMVTQSLLNACNKGKVAPIYLFHGSRGTGKTSCARIFAASLNCLSLEDQRPCYFCRECVFMQNGKSKDVKEINGNKINNTSRIKSLVKSASLVPYSSRFRVFIIEECHVLNEEAWGGILKSLDEPYRHSVYIMVTDNLESVPRNYLLHCQKFHFPKIKIGDVVYRLQRICVEERLEFESGAIELIAGKCNGSLRDAETLLDQLGLIGKKITVSLVNELIGSVSDDDLIELLDLALSSDTTNTVRKAREMMSASVDPLQLVSQLANLIMDILAGRCQSGLSDISKSFFGRYALAEAGMRRLRHALKILSEAEKHLRSSRNQSTWVTVALLQFGQSESSPFPTNDSQSRASFSRDDWVSRDNLSSAICYACSHDKSNCSERHCRRLKLENIWTRSFSKFQNKSIRNFLLKEGYLSSVHVTEELAIAEVGFERPEFLAKAEKLQNLISNSLQSELGCDVQVRLKLVTSIPGKPIPKSKKPSFSLLNCHKQSLSSDEFEIPVSSKTGIYNPSQEIASNRSEFNMPKKAMSENGECVKKEREFNQPSCFARTVRFQRKLFRMDSEVCLGIPVQSKMSGADKEYDAYFYAYDSYTDCYGANSQATCSSREDNLSRNSRIGSMLCWRTPKYSI